MMFGTGLSFDDTVLVALTHEKATGFKHTHDTDQTKLIQQKTEHHVKGM